MPKHCAALPGASNELLGSSTAELATALLERFGAIPAPRDGGPRRHAAAVPAQPEYAPKQRARRPSRPVLAAMSVTAISAVAAVTATGQFAAVAPANAALTLSDTATPIATPIAAPVAPVAAPPIASALTSALQTVRVSTIVDDATSTAKAIAADAAATNAAAEKKAAAAKAAAAIPAHVPAPTPSGDAPTVSTGTGVGAQALAIAQGKIGRPYVWGAAGPNAFDCSGLVMWAFKQAGVSLPRTSAAQSQAGTAVSKTQLQPGDLVFFYSPVSHVGIYMGDGKVLDATQSGEPVQISDMAYMPFHNARRV